MRAIASETGLFRAALALIAFRVVDDNFLQPRPGISPTAHLASGLIPLVLLGLAAWVYPRLRGGRRGALALLLGVLGLATGLDAVHYTRALGVSADDVSGLLVLPAALGLLGLGAVTLWRTRGHHGHRAWRYTRRLLLGGAAVLTLQMAVLPVGIGYVSTHVATAGVPANHLGVPYENVSFTTADGLRLEGWYIPSRNGAAVISFPGRKGPQRQARMLARHGYGVLLFDRRGEGRSEGEPNTFGWGGDADIKAAAAYLQRRPDVDPGRIGGIGLSVGGELMLEAAAESDAIAAVVSDGAGPRTMGEELDADIPAIDKVFGRIPYGLKDATIAVLTNRMPPKHLKRLVPRIAPRPLLLIADPTTTNGEDLNRLYHRVAHEPKALWEIPGAGHVNGVVSRSAEYERRVVGFFDEAL